MSLTLKLLHLWGTPQAWKLDGEDEEALALMLGRSRRVQADTKFKRAVLLRRRQDCRELDA
jgi:hypothetical protein